ncbi:MAG TPA: GAF and ANTAR domain-containing protein [Nocardioides sp.]|uniref:GAF and ANTAR domain-containing protein n=1 Tax=Nocardioides sp. TaxID=35761 RepID=UPI002F3FAA20
MDIDFNRLLADAARELAQEPSAVTTLERVVELCTDEVPGCDDASISVAEDGEIRTVAATDDSLLALDRLQVILGEGPCLEAVRSREAVVSNDLFGDTRWPAWSPRVVEEAGLRSLMSFCLYSSGESAGTLILYSRKDDGFDPEDLLEAQVLAAQAAVALATNLKERQLHQALETRTVIGQATGILIERFGLTPDQAFAVMRRVSQHHNIKLHVLAEHLVQTGVLLDPSRPGEPRRQADGVGGVDGFPVDGVPHRSTPAEDVTQG